MSDISKLAGSLGQASDLVIVGQPIKEDATRADDALLEGTLFRSGRPCLMFPRWNEPHAWGKRILIAWKDVREAARAVHDAMPLLQRADAVCVVTIQHGSHAERSSERSTKRLLRHLGRLGVKAESRVVLTDEPDGPALLDQAERWPADLLVMGGYGHSQFRELAFGGVTQTAIRRSRIPVLLSH
jgi:nucleotide-binding universal stress UspA family protein